MMGGMVGRWASLLATRDGLPSLGEHWRWLQLAQGLVAAQRGVRGNFEEKSLFWLIHMDTSKICFFNRYDPSCLIQFKLSSQEAYLLFSSTDNLLAALNWRDTEVAACQSQHPPVAATRRWWLLPLGWAGVLGCLAHGHYTNNMNVQNCTYNLQKI